MRIKLHDLFSQSVMRTGSANLPGIISILHTVFFRYTVHCMSANMANSAIHTLGVDK